MDSSLVAMLLPSTVAPSFLENLSKSKSKGNFLELSLIYEMNMNVVPRILREASKISDHDEEKEC